MVPASDCGQTKRPDPSLDRFSGLFFSFLGTSFDTTTWLYSQPSSRKVKIIVRRCAH